MDSQKSRSPEMIGPEAGAEVKAIRNFSWGCAVYASRRGRRSIERVYIPMWFFNSVLGAGGFRRLLPGFAGPIKERFCEFQKPIDIAKVAGNAERNPDGAGALVVFAQHHG